MSINKEGNVYTIVFASIMVIVVGGLLAYVSSSLKPLQEANVKNEKMQNILQSIGLEELEEMEKTKELTREKAGEIFNDYITERIVLNYDGEVLYTKTNADSIAPKDMTDAFNVNVRKYYNKLTTIMKKSEGNELELKKSLKEGGITYPLFVCEKGDKKYYITYFSGKGLWDDIWGYVSFQEDGKTISGTVFDHKGETPGLGSKIKDEKFNVDFIGKVILDENNEYRPIKILKPGNDKNEYQVEGISGATFSTIGDGNNMGVEKMMSRSLEVYSKYFKSLRKEKEAEMNISTDTNSMLIDTISQSIDSTILATK